KSNSARERQMEDDAWYDCEKREEENFHAEMIRERGIIPMAACNVVHWKGDLSLGTAETLGLCSTEMREGTYASNAAYRTTFYRRRDGSRYCDRYVRWTHRSLCSGSRTFGSGQFHHHCRDRWTRRDCCWLHCNGPGGISCRQKRCRAL